MTGFQGNARIHTNTAVYLQNVDSNTVPADQTGSLPRRVDAPFSKEIDIDLLAFVERYATNLARWDILVLFGQSPQMLENAQTIAKRIGRRATSIEKELEDLVYLGVLRGHQNGKGMSYALTREPAMQEAVIRLARHQARAHITRSQTD